MKVYHLDPAGFVEVRRRFLRATAFGLLIFLAYQTLLKLVPVLAPGRSATNVPVTTTIIITAIIFGFTGLYWLRELRRYRKSWLSYELQIGSDVILRKQDGFADVEIRVPEISSIEEVKESVFWFRRGFSPLAQGSGLIIRTRDRFKYIFIDHNLEGFEAVKLQLAQWGIPASSGEGMLKRLLLGADLFLSMVGVLFADRVPSVEIARLMHLAAAIGLLWGFVEFRRSPEIESRQKRLAWSFLLLAIMEGLRGSGMLYRGKKLF